MLTFIECISLVVFHVLSIWLGPLRNSLVCDVNHSIFSPAGALMFVAWMTTVSIGVLVARFFKSVWSKAFFGQAAWFQVSGRKGLMQFPYYLNIAT